MQWATLTMHGHGPLGAGCGLRRVSGSRTDSPFAPGSRHVAHSSSCRPTRGARAARPAGDGRSRDTRSIGSAAAGVRAVHRRGRSPACDDRAALAIRRSLRRGRHRGGAGLGPTDDRGAGRCTHRGVGPRARGTPTCAARARARPVVRPRGARPHHGAHAHGVVRLLRGGALLVRRGRRRHPARLVLDRAGLRRFRGGARPHLRPAAAAARRPAPTTAPRDRGESVDRARLDEGQRSLLRQGQAWRIAAAEPLPHLRALRAPLRGRLCGRRCAPVGRDAGQRTPRRRWPMGEHGDVERRAAHVHRPAPGPGARGHGRAHPAVRPEP